MWTTDTRTAVSPPIVGVTPPRRLSLAGDERLARLVRDGSEDAFAALYERYHQRLYRYCRSMLRNDADAQDALQSTFAGAYTALADGRRDAPMRPWLYRIAYNESVSMLRRRRPEASLVEANELPSASAEQRASERARLALLVADLGELAERQRGALVMRELSGLSHEEIAVALGVSIGAAKQTIFEARRSLAEFAQGRAMACDDVCRAVSDGNGRVLRGRKVRAHLRDCASCAAFAGAIPARSRDLRAIAPPLSMFAAASLLRRALGTCSGHTTGSGTGVAAGAAGKAATVAVAAKALASVAVVATAAVGVSGVVRSLVHSPSRPAAVAVRSHGTAAAPLRAPSRIPASASRATAVKPHAAANVDHSTARATRTSSARGHAHGRASSATPVGSAHVEQAAHATSAPGRTKSKSVHQRPYSAPIKRGIARARSRRAPAARDRRAATARSRVTPTARPG